MMWANLGQTICQGFQMMVGIATGATLVLFVFATAILLNGAICEGVLLLTGER